MKRDDSIIYDDDRQEIGRVRWDDQEYDTSIDGTVYLAVQWEVLPGLTRRSSNTVPGTLRGMRCGE